VKRLNGHKRLVRGNHDIFKTKDYLQAGFDEIYGVRSFDSMILSHIPLHPRSIKKGWTNVHGHLHLNVEQFGWGPQYFNVSVEQINYTPISLEEVRKRISVAIKVTILPKGDRE
jgi:calcineurin-like phosphoesterase family protein